MRKYGIENMAKRNCWAGVVAVKSLHIYQELDRTQLRAQIHTLGQNMPSGTGPTTTNAPTLSNPSTGAERKQDNLNSNEAIFNRSVS